jgi:hypothetical protein
MNKLLYFLFFIGGLSLTIQLSSCKKPLIFSKDNLSFSKDTVVFDTVFTTIGSTTNQFKLYNNSKRTLQVETVELMGGENSPFRINVDGVSGTNFAPFEVEGEDSLFIFVEVTLDPNGGVLPMVIEDSIRFRTNGIDQYVMLVAWGQDAYFHYSDFSVPNGGGLDINSGIWPNDKPHVILNTAFIDSATSLTIQAGTNIYLHKGAILYNYKGSLNIQGTKDFPVTFQGDRLEAAYDDVAGQYYGIYMQEAMESTIDYAIIRNGISGIHLYDDDPSNPGYTLNLYNTVIENCARYGVFIYSGAKVKAENCIINRNGTHALLVLEGGSFNFNHCHLLGFGGFQDQGPAVGISNYYTDQLNAVTYVGSIDEGTITNSIIYGSFEHELAIDTLLDLGITVNFSFVNNLIRSVDVFTDPFYIGNIWNSSPLFTNTSDGDFHWAANSPVNDAGSPSFPVTNTSTFNSDIEGTSRSGPDIGAYEKI